MEAVARAWACTRPGPGPARARFLGLHAPGPARARFQGLHAPGSWACTRLGAHAACVQISHRRGLPGTGLYSLPGEDERLVAPAVQRGHLLRVINGRAGAASTGAGEDRPSRARGGRQRGVALSCKDPRVERILKKNLMLRIPAAVARGQGLGNVKPCKDRGTSQADAFARMC
ncbi:hypothetical protein NDU88_000662 [Pleurodeles waltl]|uniref:Uncharacterized protein n=1 Tax=Pleurodeles waltl TaxID=8319 RepID=A0AAV7LX66_PLEWA|nr:hypothetical protein NDU88_000662 [Pleurodeles waltl]